MESPTRQLKKGLSQLSFIMPTITTTEQRLEAHQLVIDLLSLAEKLDSEASSAPKTKISALGSKDKVAQEINKVKRRLKLWALRPHQVNTQLLSAFLELQESTYSSVPLDKLSNALGDPTKFVTNFNQMCVIASNNHGKIFVVNNREVSLWEPIVEDVLSFKEALRENGALS